MRISEAERLFNEEVREKKRAGIGVFSRASRRGYVGKMFFPYELASRKEKSKHKRAGKVMTTNLFDKILPAAEFDQLEEYEQRNRMAYWRNTYTTNEIKKEMGTSGTKFYALLEKLGIPKDGQKTRSGHEKNKSRRIQRKGPRQESSKSASSYETACQGRNTSRGSSSATRAKRSAAAATHFKRLKYSL